MKTIYAFVNYSKVIFIWRSVWEGEVEKKYGHGSDSGNTL